MVDRRLEVSCEFVFDRLAEANVAQAYRILVPERRRATRADHRGTARSGT